MPSRSDISCHPLPLFCRSCGSGAGPRWEAEWRRRTRATCRARLLAGQRLAAWKIGRHSWDDAGIDFQWGAEYIRSDEVIEGIGGRYRRWNGDGSITEYRPPRFRTKCAAMGLGYCYRFEARDSVGYTELEFETPQLAKQAAREIDCSMFFSARSIEAIAEGAILYLKCILGRVFEYRYFPARGPKTVESLRPCHHPKRCLLWALLDLASTRQRPVASFRPASARSRAIRGARPRFSLR